MIIYLVALSALSLQALTSKPADVEPETIEVIGQRLQNVKVSAKGGRNDSFSCTMTQSSGSARIDAAMTDLFCEATRTCVARKISRSRTMQRCVQGILKPQIRALAERIAHEDAATD